LVFFFFNILNFHCAPLLLLLLHFSLASPLPLSLSHPFAVCLCMCASAKVIYCYKYLLVSFLSTLSLRFLWRTLVFFILSVSVLYFSLLVVLYFLFSPRLLWHSFPVYSVLRQRLVTVCFMSSDQLSPSFTAPPHPIFAPFTLFACFCCILFSVILLNRVYPYVDSGFVCVFLYSFLLPGPCASHFCCFF